MTTMLPLGRHSDSLWCRAQTAWLPCPIGEKSLPENYDARRLSEVYRVPVWREPRVTSRHAVARPAHAEPFPAVDSEAIVMDPD